MTTTDDWPARRAALRALLTRATPGTWSVTRYAGGLDFSGALRAYAGTNPEYGEPWPVPRCDADHELVAAMHRALPRLLADSERAERLAAALREIERDAARYSWLWGGIGGHIAQLAHAALEGGDGD